MKLEYKNVLINGNRNNQLSIKSFFSENFGKYPIRNEIELSRSISLLNGIRKRLNQLKKSKETERALRQKAFCEGKLSVFTSNAFTSRNEKK